MRRRAGKRPGLREMPTRDTGFKGSSESGKRILVVEDDLPLAKLLRRYLEAESYQVSLAHDGESARESVNSNGFDLMLLDLNIPKLDGIGLLQQLRPSHPKLPILVLTGRSAVEDRVLSLDNGADDCLNKPFSFAELLARVKALLRRNSEAVSKVSQVGDLSLDREEWRVERKGRRIEMTPREFSVLEYLMRNADRPVTRANIMEEVWGVPFDASTNVVDVYVKYVRDKVDIEGEEKLIRTVRGVGYMLSNAS